MAIGMAVLTTAINKVWMPLLVKASKDEQDYQHLLHLMSYYTLVVALDGLILAALLPIFVSYFCRPATVTLSALRSRLCSATRRMASTTSPPASDGAQGYALDSDGDGDWRREQRGAEFVLVPSIVNS